MLRGVLGALKGSQPSVPLKVRGTPEMEGGMGHQGTSSARGRRNAGRDALALVIGMVRGALRQPDALRTTPQVYPVQVAKDGTISVKLL